jgi:hypothetical protein
VLDTSTWFGPDSADVYGDPADVLPRTSHSPVCNPGAHLDTQRLHRVTNRHGAADRPLWAVEHREETVTRGVHFAAPEAV